MKPYRQVAWSAENSQQIRWRPWPKILSPDGAQLKKLQHSEEFRPDAVAVLIFRWIRRTDHLQKTLQLFTATQKFARGSRCLTKAW